MRVRYCRRSHGRVKRVSYPRRIRPAPDGTASQTAPPSAAYPRIPMRTAPWRTPESPTAGGTHPPAVGVRPPRARPRGRPCTAARPPRAGSRTARAHSRMPAAPLSAFRAAWKTGRSNARAARSTPQAAPARDRRTADRTRPDVRPTPVPMRRRGYSRSARNSPACPTPHALDASSRF